MLQLMFVAGFVALGVGLWWLSPAAALIVLGLIMCGLAWSGVENERRAQAIRKYRKMQKSERMRILAAEGAEQGDDDGE
jgi:hypothetical protein